MKHQQAYLIWEKPALFIQLKQLEPHVSYLGNAKKTNERHQLKLDNQGNLSKAPGTLKIVHELHPLFGAEVSGVDFSKSISDDIFEQILKAIAKVQFNIHLIPAQFLADHEGLISNIAYSTVSSFSVAPGWMMPGTSSSPVVSAVFSTCASIFQKVGKHVWEASSWLTSVISILRRAS